MQPFGLHLIVGLVNSRPINGHNHRIRLEFQALAQGVVHDVLILGIAVDIVRHSARQFEGHSVANGVVGRIHVLVALDNLLSQGGHALFGGHGDVVLASGIQHNKRHCVGISALLALHNQVIALLSTRNCFTSGRFVSTEGFNLCIHRIGKCTGLIGGHLLEVVDDFRLCLLAGNGLQGRRILLGHGVGVVVLAGCSVLMCFLTCLVTGSQIQQPVRLELGTSTVNCDVGSKGRHSHSSSQNACEHNARNLIFLHHFFNSHI